MSALAAWCNGRGSHAAPCGLNFFFTRGSFKVARCLFCLQESTALGAWEGTVWARKACAATIR